MATDEEVRAAVVPGASPGHAPPEKASAPVTPSGQRVWGAVRAFALDWFIVGYVPFVALFVLNGAINALWLPSQVAANPLLDGISYSWRQSGGDIVPGSETVPRFFLYLLAALPITALLTPTRATLGQVIAGVARPTVRSVARPWYRTLWGMTAAVVLALTFAAGWSITEVNPGLLLQRLPRAWRITEQLLTPDWEVFWLAARLMLESIFLALIATVFAVIFAVPLSFLGARNIMRGSPTRVAIYTAVRGFFNVFRSIQELVFAILFVTVVGIGAFAGMLALLVHSIATLGKLYSEQIENIDPGPIEAVTATGANRLQVVLYAVVPQVVAPFLAFTIYRWDINVRAAIVVGFVGGGGIGLALFQYQQLTQWHRVGTVALLTVIVVWILDAVSARVREQLT